MRILSVAILLALASPVFVAPVFAAQTEVATPSARESEADARFTALTEREMKWSYGEFPLGATYAGVHDHDDELGDVSEAAWKRRAAHWNETLKALDAIDPTTLSKANRVNYRIFRDQVENSARGVAVKNYLLPLNSDSAYYTEITQLPRAQPLSNAAEYRAYLARLRDLPRWLDQHTALLEQGIAEGITVPKVVLVGRDEALAKHAEVKSPEESAFYEPFKKMPASIAADEAEKLRAEGRKVIADEVLPAYRKTLSFLRDSYIPKSRETIAATEMPNGAAFYRQQIREYTTLDSTADEIHAIGQSEVKRIRAEMEAIVREVKYDGSFADFLTFLRTDPQFYAKTPEEILMRAAWIAKRVDGVLPKYFGMLPRKPFGIAPVPAAIAPFYTAGRYAGAPEGSTEPGFYWVNTTKLESRPLYALPALTLHEAVPGHHLQNALASEQGEQPIYRRTSYISAFGEGWGLYAEHLGVEMGIYQTPYEHFGRLTYEMWRACRLVVDTGMHAKGWTRDQAVAFMRDNTALSEHEINTEIDRYISWPGQALSYKLGELKIRELRKKAEQELGPKFDLRAFHDRILALGSVPLDLLSAEVDDFVAENR